MKPANFMNSNGKRLNNHSNYDVNVLVSRYCEFGKVMNFYRCYGISSENTLFELQGQMKDIINFNKLQSIHITS